MKNLDRISVISDELSQLHNSTRIGHEWYSCGMLITLYKEAVLYIFN